MNLHEYQAKEIIKRCGIAVPQGEAVNSVEAGMKLSKTLGFPLAIKAQVQVGGRGKAGAIRIVKDQGELEKGLPEIFAMEVKGLKVKKILIEKALDIKRQFYLGITVDRSKQCNVIMVSCEGGIDIEETAKTYPEKIVSMPLKAANKLEAHEVDRLVSALKLEGRLSRSFADIIKSLFAVYINIDSQLVEINPLVLTREDRLVACDAKIIIDDNALFRQENLESLKEEAEDNELEREAHRRNLAYVKLSGNIGIIGNGAGLVMATMDEVKRAGGSPADFLDIGGGAKKEVVQNALEIIYQDKQVKGIFINVFGGITRCDEVAKGIIQAAARSPKGLPIVLRLAGTQCEEGRRLLWESALISVESMEEGAKKIGELVKG